MIEVNVNMISNYKLSQNYSNPFNPATTNAYSILKNGYVELKIYNLLGQEITIINKEMPAGNYNVTWNARNLSSGVYLYKITVNDFSQTNKMVLMKKLFIFQ